MPEGRQFIEILMIYLLQHLPGLGFDHPEVQEQAGLIQPLSLDKNFHLPVVAVQGFTLAVKVLQAVGRGKLGNHFQFVHVISVSCEIRRLAGA